MRIILKILIALLLFALAAAIVAVMLLRFRGSSAVQNGYARITQEEAARVMAEETGWLLLDVRRADEFAEGHIPGAMNLPNERIGAAEIAELPDKGQTLLVYCRSGSRSKDAAAKLAALGYRDVREFGGIIDWTGEIVTD